MTDHLDDLSRARSIGPACVEWAQDVRMQDLRFAGRRIIDGNEFWCVNGHVSRCTGAIYGGNTQDARWANEVLNRFGHLVPHPGDSL